MGRAGSPTAGVSISMAIFPKKKFTKDRPRRSADDEHHFEGGSLATRKLDSANERLLARPRRAPGGEARAADASRA
jgi:hypothetical protein